MLHNHTVSRPMGGRARRGSLSVELLLILPIVLILLLGLIEFGTWLEVGRKVSTAGRQGARVAALGGSVDDVDRAVRRSLGNGPMSAAQVYVSASFDGEPGEPVAVRVEIPAALVVPDLLGLIGLGHGDRKIGTTVVMRRE